MEATNRTWTNVGPDVYVSNDGVKIERDGEGWVSTFLEEGDGEQANWRARRINRNSVLAGVRRTQKPATRMTDWRLPENKEEALPPTPIGRPRKPDSQINYDDAHYRVRQARGRASTHTCPCGSQAEHWAFQHSGEAQVDEQGRHFSANMVLR